MKNWKPHSFHDIVECNPKVSMKKGEIVENCEMEDIQPKYKFLYPREGKLYNGGNSKFQNGDTVFARITPCLENGKIAQIKDLKGNKGIGSTEFFVFRGKDKITDNNFVYYLCKTNLVIDTAINSMTGASGRQRADIKVIKNLIINLPSPTIQKQIASVLSSYDDLIEINNKRIKILEDTAKEIYKEWFVRMRFPGYKQVKFVKGIPEGWVIKKLGNVIELLYGKALKDEDRKGGNIPVYGSSGVVGYHNAFISKAPGIVVGRKGNVGSVFWVNKDFYPIDTAYYVKSQTSLFYIYYNLLTQNFIDGDAAVPGLSRSQAYSNLIIVPVKDLLIKFDELINPIFKCIDNYNLQNNELRQIRDRLLPRLIGGKLRVKEQDFLLHPETENDTK